MALIQCPECKKKISESADNCPRCGYRLSIEEVAEIKKDQVIKRRFYLFAIIVLFATYIFRGFSSSDSPRSALADKVIVKNSEWDGSVKQVKSWLEVNLKDPDSLQFIEWSAVQKTKDGGFIVRAKYRAKNSFGGYVIENAVFILDSSGNVVNSVTE